MAGDRAGAQRRIVEAAYSGPARVSGSAGTGKTIVALHRAVHLARAHPDARVLLATFSDTLANTLRVRLGRLVHNRPSIAERLEVNSMGGIGRRLYEANFGAATLVAEGEVRALIDLAAAEVGGHAFSPHFLWTEWSQVVDAWQLEGWEDYRDVMRLGRKTRLAESQRAMLWSIFTRVRDGLDERGLLTEPRMFRRMERHVSEGVHPPFEFYVIDEAQDIGVSELRFLAALGGGRPDSLFFAGDLGQRIFRTPFSWRALGVDVRGRSHTLRINYRTSHQIRRQADCLLPPELADVDGITERRGGTVSAFNGPQPGIRVLASPDEEAAAVADWLAELRQEGFAPHEIAVFVRSEGEIARAREAVRLADLSSIELDERSDGASGKVAVATMHLAKGLEFRAVAVMACDDEVLPPAITHRERGRRSRLGRHLQHGTAASLRCLHARPRSFAGDRHRARVRVPRRSADESVNSSVGAATNYIRSIGYGSVQNGYALVIITTDEKSRAATSLVAVQFDQWGSAELANATEFFRQGSRYRILFP